MAYAGETAAPLLADVLRVAKNGGIEKASAQRGVERMRAMAADLPQRAAELPIRKATLRSIVKAVGANCMRLTP